MIEAMPEVAEPLLLFVNASELSCELSLPVLDAAGKWQVLLDTGQTGAAPVAGRLTMLGRSLILLGHRASDA